MTASAWLTSVLFMAETVFAGFAFSDRDSSYKEDWLLQ